MGNNVYAILRTDHRFHTPQQGSIWDIEISKVIDQILKQSYGGQDDYSILLFLGNGEMEITITNKSLQNPAKEINPEKLQQFSDDLNKALRGIAFEDTENIIMIEPKTKWVIIEFEDPSLLVFTLGQLATTKNIQNDLYPFEQADFKTLDEKLEGQKILPKKFDLSAGGALSISLKRIIEQIKSELGITAKAPPYRTPKNNLDG